MCTITIIPNMEAFREKIKEPEKRLLQMAEIMEAPRNIDACGFFAVDNEYKRYTIARLPVPCGIFFEYLYRNKILKALIENSSMLMIHARATTVGNPLKNTNNHPFYIEENNNVLALIHNGSIRFRKSEYADEIDEFAEKHLNSDTDSARLLAAIHLLTDESMPLIDRIEEALKDRFIGKASIAVMNLEELVYIRNSAADITYFNIEEGIPIFATRQEILKPIIKEIIKKYEYTIYDTYKPEIHKYANLTGNMIFYFKRGKLISYKHRIIIEATQYTYSSSRYSATRYYPTSCTSC